MSRTGRVAGVTKILNSGPSAELWDLVLLGDGFLAEDLSEYRSITERFVEYLFSTAPFDEFRSSFNVHRVDVISDERGAGDLIRGIRRATYFDSTFGANNLDRLLTTDQTVALETAADAVPQMNAALVVVNSSDYGGSGGEVPVFSRNESAFEIAVHEMGHGHFLLGDEYEGYSDAADESPSVFRDPEPFQKNVTASLDPLKWRALVTPGCPIPTRVNGQPREEIGEYSVLAGAVGAFEGAMYHEVGVYRPAESCRMRVLGVGFCPVCVESIRNVLAPFRRAPAKRRAVRSR